MARFDEAVATLARAVEIDPGSFAAHYNLAGVLAAQRRLSEAEAAYRRAVAAAPQEPWGHVNLGYVLQEQGQLTAAIGCFERAIAIAPALAPAHANLGSALYETGRLEAAVAALRRALQLAPEDAKTEVTLAQTLQAMGDLAGAEAAFRRALALEPGLMGAQAHLSILLQQCGKAREAAALLDYQTFLRRHRLADALGAPDVAAFNAELERYIRAHPTLQRDPPGKATQHGSQTLELLNCGDPPIAALQGFFERAVEDYLATTLGAGANPFAAPRPPRWRLHGWAVVLRSSGHQTPHFHPAGVVSGVYYVRLPRSVKAGVAGEAGHIRFGTPLDAPAAEAAAQTFSVRPEEGMLILFPSYFWHHTVPFESEEERISIAFDVLPEAGGAERPQPG
jgi:tetratricopeptide (TPR) repeat protein